MSGAEFIKTVREYRQAVRMYDETLIYGWLQKARALGKKIDAELESEVDIDLQILKYNPK